MQPGNTLEQLHTYLDSNFFETFVCEHLVQRKLYLIQNIISLQTWVFVSFLHIFQICSFGSWKLKERESWISWIRGTRKFYRSLHITVHKFQWAQHLKRVLLESNFLFQESLSIWECLEPIIASLPQVIWSNKTEISSPFIHLPFVLSANETKTLRAVKSRALHALANQPITACCILCC